MLAQIRDSFCSRATKTGVLAIVAAVLASCATKPPPQIVSDPSAGPESALPWNQQEKWEQEGQFGAMTDRMGGGTR